MNLSSHRGQLTLKIDGLSTDVQVWGFSGHDGLSELFVYDVEISSEKPIDAAAVIGASGLLTLAGSGFLHGLVNRCELCGMTGTLRRYVVRLVPFVWPLAQGQSCRIFQELTVQQIVEQLFGEWGLAAPHFSLKAELERRVFCVQYQESDWAFVSRLLEESGIYYFFTHSAGAHEIVFTNDGSPHPKVQAHTLDSADTTELPYHPPAGQDVVDDHVTELWARHELRPDTYVVREQQLERPWGLATFDDSRPGPQSKPIEVYEYIGEPKGRQPARLPRARLEERRVQTLWLEGASTCPALRAGVVFDLVGYVDATLDQELLVVQVEHRCTQAQGESGKTNTFDYGNHFTCILRSAPFRPPLVTPRPVIYGVQAATVVGPAGEEIYTDDLGRVKAHFPWDRSGPSNERSSAWIPVAQLAAGGGWGALFIPRIGQQVIVQFVDGDPDQPLIVGQVYHRRNMPPSSLPAQKTMTVIKSSSSPASGGFNEIRLEDKGSAEMLSIRAELDRTDLVQRDQATSVGRNETTTVANNETHTVGANYSESVGGNYDQQIGGNKGMRVAGAQTETVGGSVSYTVGGTQLEVIGGARVVHVQLHTEQVAGVRQHSVGGANVLQVGGNESMTVGGNTAVTTGGSTAVTTGGSLSVTVGAAATVKSGGAMSIKAGGPLKVSAPTIVVEAGDKLVLKQGGAQIVLQGGKVSIKGDAVTVKASGDVSIKGSTVKQN